MQFEKLNFESSKSLYLQVADMIKTRILNHEIATGSRIPPERELSKTFNVSRITINEAMGKLEKDGYLQRRRKLGTIVINSSPASSTAIQEQAGLYLIICSDPAQRRAENPYPPRTMNGIDEKVKEKKMRLLFKTLHEDEELNIEEKGLAIAGFIVAGAITPRHLQTIKKSHKPFVLIGDVYQGSITEEKTDIITNDDSESICLAAAHLIKLGHRKIVYMCNHFDKYPWDKDGLRGYKKALGDAGLPCSPSLMIEGKFGEDNAYIAMKNFLEKPAPEPFTAVVFKNLPSLYLGAMRAFKEKNIRVPEDVSLIATEIFRGMTAFYCDSYAAGAAAFDRLYERITNPAWEPRRIIMPSELHEGGTAIKLEKQGE
ncbi:MAG: hypothetical protein A2297_02185 [Elusimicrobia bacterium RIFOXYB2_FULL_48_7]|nr:MAG: hypothetical protein A2297_02185 [Elusimicrobia bacterium RIFOXYB2_FULL_48_7]